MEDEVDRGVVGQKWVGKSLLTHKAMLRDPQVPPQQQQELSDLVQRPARRTYKKKTTKHSGMWGQAEGIGHEGL